jgi:predicted phosphodiesterase
MSRPTNEELRQALVANGGNATAAARQLGVAGRTMRRWVSEMDLSDSLTVESKIDSDKRKISSQKAVDGSMPDTALHVTVDELMAQYGLSADEWVPTKLDTSERDAGTANAPKVSRTVSASFAPRPKLPTPAFDGRPITVKPPKRTKTRHNTELVLILSDYHAPYVDWDLHQASLRLIAENQPDRIIVNGDLVDFPTVGRHRVTTTRCMATASECIASGGRVLADLRAAAPEDCRIDFIPGNHDGWLNNKILAEVSSIYDLTAYGDDKPVWSFSNLFRLDDLGINLVGEPDTWPHSSIALTPHLVVHHGDVARKGSGASPLASMAGKDFAEIHGHTHRQSLVGRTVWLADGSTRVYQGGECGAMCVMEANGFPVYTRHPDWQPGFASVELDLDDRGEVSGWYSVDMASWQNSKLMWRGQIYV